MTYCSLYNIRIKDNFIVQSNDKDQMLTAVSRIKLQFPSGGVIIMFLYDEYTKLFLSAFRMYGYKNSYKMFSFYSDLKDDSDDLAIYNDIFYVSLAYTETTEKYITDIFPYKNVHLSREIISLYYMFKYWKQVLHFLITSLLQ